MFSMANEIGLSDATTSIYVLMAYIVFIKKYILIVPSFVIPIKVTVRCQQY